MRTQLRIVGMVVTAGALWVAIGMGMSASAGDSEREPAGAFAREPSVRKQGESWLIDFAVRTPCDATVALVGPDGKIVRHLAGGVLGANAPEPFRAGSLEQSLTWDRRDDAGRRVPPGRYMARVSLGLRPVLDKCYGPDHTLLGVVHGLAVSPNGELYVLGEEGRDCRDPVVRVFSRAGEYVRTILPRPGNLPLERALPLGELVLDGGERFPTCQIPQYGGRRFVAPVATPEGDLILSNNSRVRHVETKRFRSLDFLGWNGSKPVHEALPRRLLRVASDGGAPTSGCLGPVLGSGFDDGMLCLAQGPDGRVYVSGARHAVFRAKWGENERPEPFVGTPDKAGDGEQGLRNPEGIAFDAKGRLLVADTGNHRVAIFDANGRLSGSLAVEWPRKVLVNHRTGAVYVAAGKAGVKLLKFASPESAQSSAAMPIGGDWPLLALDDDGKQSAIYVYLTGDTAGVAAHSLVKVVDSGNTLRVERVLSGPERARQPLLAGVDRERELVYGAWPWNNYWRMDGRTGRIERFDIPLHPQANGVSELTVGVGGNVLVHVTGAMARLTPDLAPMPFAALGTFIVSGLKEDCLRSYYAKDCCEAPNGNIYRIHERGGYSQPFRVSEIAADGSPGRDSLVVLDSASAAGIRVDRRGCIYVLEHLKPVGQPVPPVFAGKTPGGKLDAHVEHYGSLLKFSPQGGAVRKLARKGAPIEADEVRFMVGVGDTEFAARGLEWSRYGVSILRSWHANSGCKCWTPRFDLDEFGRVFVPDQLRCRILVFDANGNPITSFGRYGNSDDRGPGVPLADPRTVMVSREAAYVGDMSNQRVVRVRLESAAHAECALVVQGAGDAPQPEAAPAADSEQARAAALLTLGSSAPGAEIDTKLTAALGDESELVRAAAGYMLVRRGNVAGAAEMFRGALSKHPAAYALAETAILKEMTKSDSKNKLAAAVDPRTPLVPRFAVGPAEVKALVALLDCRDWYLRRVALVLLGQSGSEEAAAELLKRFDGFRDRNLNRAVGALGVLRCRAAVPNLVALVRRGRDPKSGTDGYNGDQAEQYAVRALARIGDPACVEPLIALIDVTVHGV